VMEGSSVGIGFGRHGGLRRLFVIGY
jgi:hypothetical protein